MIPRCIRARSSSARSIPDQAGRGRGVTLRNRSCFAEFITLATAEVTRLRLLPSLFGASGKAAELADQGLILQKRSARETRSVMRYFLRSLSGKRAAAGPASR